MELSAMRTGAPRLWQAVDARLAANPRYRVKRMTAQVGLLPLGPDPKSGLEEFCHLASGERVTRGADGALALGKRSAIVLVLLPATADAPRLLVAKHELTQAQWGMFRGRARPSRYPYQSHVPVEADGRVEQRKVTTRHPVERVEWRETVELLARHGLRLPTTTEWERAARGGTRGPFWTGATRATLAGKENVADALTRRLADPTATVAAERADDHAVHAPVGRFAANPYGCTTSRQRQRVVRRGRRARRPGDPRRQLARGGRRPRVPASPATRNVVARRARRANGGRRLGRPTRAAT